MASHPSPLLPWNFIDPPWRLDQHRCQAKGLNCMTTSIAPTSCRAIIAGELDLHQPVNDFPLRVRLLQVSSDRL